MSLSDIRNDIVLAVRLLEQAQESAEMRKASFGNIWAKADDPLPTTEREVTDFIKRRVELYMGSWVLGPIASAMIALKKISDL